MVGGYHNYQSICDNPLAYGDLLCEWETGNSHDLQAVAIKMMIDGTLQVVGHVSRVPRKISLKISSICLQYYSHVRLYYRCIKIWLVRIWWFLVSHQFRQFFASPKIPSIWYITTYTDILLQYYNKSTREWVYTCHYTILWPILHYYYLKSVIKEVGKFRGLKIESAVLCLL